MADETSTETPDLRLRIMPANEGPMALVMRAPVLVATDLTLALSGKSIEVWVGVAGIKVAAGVPVPGDRARVEALVHGTLLDAAHNPEAHFRGEFRRGSDQETVEVGGTLTLRGVSRPIVTVLKANGPARWTGKLTIRQRDFGIEPARAFAGALVSRDEVVLAVDVIEGKAP
jgi:polyisoprenoid-binding protein YceI